MHSPKSPVVFCIETAFQYARVAGVCMQAAAPWHFTGGSGREVASKGEGRWLCEAQKSTVGCRGAVDKWQTRQL